MPRNFGAFFIKNNRRFSDFLFENCMKYDIFPQTENLFNLWQKKQQRFEILNIIRLKITADSQIFYL